MPRLRPCKIRQQGSICSFFFLCRLPKCSVVVIRGRKTKDAVGKPKWQDVPKEPPGIDGQDSEDRCIFCHYCLDPASTKHRHGYLRGIQNMSSQLVGCIGWSERTYLLNRYLVINTVLCMKRLRGPFSHDDTFVRVVCCLFDWRDVVRRPRAARLCSLLAGRSSPFATSGCAFRAPTPDEESAY